MGSLHAKAIFSAKFCSISLVFNLLSMCLGFRTARTSLKTNVIAYLFSMIGLLSSLSICNECSSMSKQVNFWQNINITALRFGKYCLICIMFYSVYNLPSGSN